VVDVRPDPEGGGLVTLHIVRDVEQGSEEWHTQRRGMVTASAVGRLLSVGYLGAEHYDCPECGADAITPCRSKVKKAGDAAGAPIKTYHGARTDLAASNRTEAAQTITPATGDDARNLTLLLAAERITGHTDPTYMSDDMWRGQEDEPLARDVYAQHFAPVSTVGFMVRDDFGFSIGYSPDGLVGDDGLLEVKSRRQKNQLSTVVDGQVPAANMAQLQCGLLVSGRAWIDYVSYAGGMKLWVKRVVPDPRWFESIIEAVRIFEQEASRLARVYQEATQGMPDTQRLDLEMVV
jgi:hypothetical protein